MADKITFEDFKNQVAKERFYYNSWTHFLANNQDNDTLIIQVLTEATTLFVESERKRLESRISELEEVNKSLLFWVEIWYEQKRYTYALDKRSSIESVISKAKSLTIK